MNFATNYSVRLLSLCNSKLLWHGEQCSDELITIVGCFTTPAVSHVKSEASLVSHYFWNSTLNAKEIFSIKY